MGNPEEKVLFPKCPVCKQGKVMEKEVEIEIREKVKSWFGRVKETVRREKEVQIGCERCGSTWKSEGQNLFTLTFAPESVYEGKTFSIDRWEQIAKEKPAKKEKFRRPKEIVGLDLATAVGLFVGIILISYGVAIWGRETVGFCNLAGVMITFGGAFAALLVNYRLKTVINAFKTVKKVFTIPEGDTETLIRRFVDFARRTRTTAGLLALEKELPSIRDDFLRRGIELVCSGADQNLIKSELETEIIFTQERHKVSRGVFTSLGKYSLAFGGVASLIGFICGFSNLQGGPEIGRTVAVALLPLFYGAVATFLIFLPMGGKLKRRSEDEILIKQVIIQGVLSLQSGELPTIMEAKLRAYLPRKEKKPVPVAPVVGPAAAPKK